MTKRILVVEDQEDSGVSSAGVRALDGYAPAVKEG
jgi:hypothetical protein